MLLHGGRFGKAEDGFIRGIVMYVRRYTVHVSTEWEETFLQNAMGKSTPVTSKTAEKPCCLVPPGRTPNSKQVVPTERLIVQ